MKIAKIIFYVLLLGTIETAQLWGNCLACPDGPYLESCFDCAMSNPEHEYDIHDPVLTCDCNVNNSGVQHTSIRINSCNNVANIINRHGELACPDDAKSLA